MESVARCCLVCKNLKIDMGDDWSSETTPGDTASLTCEMDGRDGCAWPINTPEPQARALRTIAERCAAFEVHPSLAAKLQDDWIRSDSEAWTKP